MSYGGYSGQYGGPPPSHSPQPGHDPPPGQYNQGPPQGYQQGGYQQGGYQPGGHQQGGYQQGGYPPQGYPPQQSYGAPPGGAYPSQQGYGAPPPQGQWGQPPPQQHGYGQAPPPTPPYSGSFPPQQGYPQGGQFPQQQAAYGVPPQGQYPPPQQMSGLPTPPSPGYDPHAVIPFDMTTTAERVRAAMKGMGTNEKELTAAVAKLDPLQIAGLRQAYSSRIKRNLEKDIASETSAHYEAGLLAIVRGPLLHDAYCIQKAVKGLGTNERMLNDVLVCRSNADMRAIKAAYHETFGRDMAADVQGDVSMDTERLFMMVMAATRHEDSSPIHPQQIEQDVNTLHEATEQSETAQLRVCELLTSRSDGQLQAIAQQYQQRFQKPLDAVVVSKLSGHMQDTLVLQLARATDRAMSDATQLEEAMKGPGTKDELLVQRVVRVHWNHQHLERVKRAYESKYRIGLVGRVHSETSGDYRRLMEKCLE